MAAISTIDVQVDESTSASLACQLVSDKKWLLKTTRQARVKSIIKIGKCVVSSLSSGASLGSLVRPGLGTVVGGLTGLALGLNSLFRHEHDKLDEDAQIKLTLKTLKNCDEFEMEVLIKYLRTLFAYYYEENSGPHYRLTRVKTDDFHAFLVQGSIYKIILSIRQHIGSTASLQRNSDQTLESIFRSFDQASSKV